MIDQAVRSASEGGFVEFGSNMELKGRRYDNGEPISVRIQGERIVSVEPTWPAGNANDYPWIAPGLLDLQINGHGGTWFSQEGLTSDEVIRTLQPHFQFGITRLCPTLVTNSFEALASGYLEGLGSALSGAERGLLWAGPPWMAVENAARFLADYLSGDRYFRTGDNCARARAQWQLAQRELQEVSIRARRQR